MIDAHLPDVSWAAHRLTELIGAVVPAAERQSLVTPFGEHVRIGRAPARGSFVGHREPLFDEVARGAGDRIDADRLVIVDDVMKLVRTDENAGVERRALELN